jgi:hypothetical protein
MIRLEAPGSGSNYYHRKIKGRSHDFLSFPILLILKSIKQIYSFSGEETRDEPWAWEAREFLRKKLVGEDVCFISDKPNINATREYGVVYLGKGIVVKNN